MTISKEKKKLILTNYKEYKFCAEEHEKDGNIHMYDVYFNKIKTIREMLEILEIKIDGIEEGE